jgi:hypothetical protein
MPKSKRAKVGMFTRLSIQYLVERYMVLTYHLTSFSDEDGEKRTRQKGGVGSRRMYAFRSIEISSWEFMQAQWLCGLRFRLMWTSGNTSGFSKSVKCETLI